LVLVAGLVKQDGGANNLSAAAQLRVTDAAAVNGQLIVFWQGTTPPNLDLPGIVSIKSPGGPTDRMSVVVTEPGQTADVAAALRQEAGVSTVVPDSLVHGSSWPTDGTAPNDPYYAGYQKNLPLIGVPVAWKITTGSPSVVVAVLDTGISTTNPDLAGVNWVSPYNVLAPSSAPTDVNGHGTVVAGIIVAKTNNSVGVAGIAPDVSIMPVKVLGDNGSGYWSDFISGLNYAVAHGAKIVNMSLGSTLSSSYISSYQPAFNAAYAAGVTVIASAGNDGNGTVNYPCAFTHVICVAATDNANAHASFSNVNSYIDISAPGVNIASTFTNYTYAMDSGTSMSAPHISAVAALILSAHPADSPTQIEAALESTATHLGTAGINTTFGAGQVNAGAAVDTIAPTGSISLPAYTTSTTVSATLSASDLTGVSQMRFSNDGITFGTPVTYASSYAWTITSGDGSKTLWVQYQDFAGNWSGSHSATTILDTVAPLVTYTYPTASLTYRRAASSFGFTWNETEATSGIATRSVHLETGSVVNHACSWSGSTLSVPTFSDGTAATGTVVSGGCYRLHVTMTDVAGNDSGDMVSNPVMVDVAAPTIGWTYPTSSLFRTNLDSFNFTWTDTDALSGMASRSAKLYNGTLANGVCGHFDGGVSAGVSGSSSYSASSGAVSNLGCYYVTATLTDAAGNTSTYQSSTVAVDTTAPTVSTACSGTQATGFVPGLCSTGNWFISPSVQVTLTAIDNAAGIASLVYSVDGSSSIPYAGPFSVSGDGHHQVAYVAINNAGLWIGGVIFLDIDTTAPTVTEISTPLSADGLSGWSVSDPTITLSATDTLSGVNQIFYAFDGGDPILYTAPFAAPAGQHDLTYWANDWASNASARSHLSLKVDLDLPAVSFVANNYDLTHGTSVSVVVSSSDATSGTDNASLRFTTDGGTTWGSWLPLDGQGAYTGSVTMGSTQDSLFMLRVEVRDNAGNISPPTTGPASLGVFDVLPTLPIDLGVAPIANGVCGTTVYWSSSNTITWPTDQGFCVVPRISSTTGVIGTVDGLDAVIEPLGVYTSYQIDALSPFFAAYLSGPATTNRVYYYDDGGQIVATGRFTPVHETVGPGVDVNMDITTMIGFYNPSQLDANGAPLPGQLPVIQSPISFPVTGQVVILNSGTVYYGN